MAAKPDRVTGKRLDSWKEIAAFFGRAERTVKRWEAERGLPVHRVPGGGRSAVFAYTAELADWLKGKSQELDADDSATGENETGVLGAPHVPLVLPDAGVQPAQAARVRERMPLPRIAAWMVPLVLVAGLVTYFSIGHNEPRVKALTSRQPSSAEGQNLYLGPDSVAVLPFNNARTDASTDYLSDGITEALIGSLARLPQLKVRSRDSVFRYKGKDLEVRTIGSELGVSVVVSGRVMLRGDTVEISAELTDVRDNTEIWGRRYAGRSAELISLQQQMTGDIAQQLRSTLNTAGRQQVASQGTRDPEAYSLHLKGRYAFNNRTFTRLQAAISYFNQAIAKDPEYALAYSGLADAHSVLPFFGGNPSEDFPKSNAAARKALELDATLAHPHAVLGSNEMSYDWDFAGGEAEFKKAIELDPYDATAHQWYAENLGMIGNREQDALAEINVAHQLDPQSLVIRRVIGSVLVAARRYDDAITVCKQLEQEDPAFPVAHDCLGYAYWGKQMYAQVVEEWKTYGQLSGNPDEAEFGLALDRGFRSAGWKGALTESIAVSLAQRRKGYVSPYKIARLYADLGDKEQAFQWLDTAYREHDFLLKELNTAFEVDSLRSDPRFAELVNKVGLPKLR
jgi:TolB-like protein